MPEKGNAIPPTKTSKRLQPEKTWLEEKRQNSALGAAHSGLHGQEYSGNVQGWGISSFREFQGTPYEVDIPVGRRFTPYEKIKDLISLSPETLKNEPFQYFYKHIDMLSNFNNVPYVDEGEKITKRFKATSIIEKNIQTIIDRSINEAGDFEKAVYPNTHNGYLEKHIYLRAMACLEIAEEDTSFCMSKDAVNTLYEGALNNRPAFLRFALIFDKRNKMHGNAIGLYEQFRDYITQEMLSHKSKINDDAEELLHWTYVDPTLQSNILTRSLLQTQNHEEIVSVLQQLAPVMGVEKIRKTLREYVEANPSFRPTFDAVFEYMGIDQGKEVAIDLRRDVYDQAKIDLHNEYTPYSETLPFELDLLEKELGGKQRILDVGCGTGRIMEPLIKKISGHIAGFDISENDIATIKQRNSEMDVRVGSWFAIPFEDKTFDSSYILGRSFTHNTTIPDAVTCLEEIKRVLKDDGFIILDLPDATIGEYKENIDRTQKLAQEKGLKDILPGTINDSPDLEHYFDRYIPNEEAFTTIAQLAGLKAEKLSTIPYRGSTGKENINIYWKLMKSDSPPLRIFETARLLSKIRKSNAYRWY